MHVYTNAVEEDYSWISSECRYGERHGTKQCYSHLWCFKKMYACVKLNLWNNSVMQQDKLQVNRKDISINLTTFALQTYNTTKETAVLQLFTTQASMCVFHQFDRKWTKLTEESLQWVHFPTSLIATSFGTCKVLNTCVVCHCECWNVHNEKPCYLSRAT